MDKKNAPKYVPKPEGERLRGDCPVGWIPQILKYKHALIVAPVQKKGLAIDALENTVINLILNKKAGEDPVFTYVGKRNEFKRFVLHFNHMCKLHTGAVMSRTDDRLIYRQAVTLQYAPPKMTRDAKGSESTMIIITDLSMIGDDVWDTLRTVYSNESTRYIAYDRFEDREIGRYFANCHDDVFNSWSYDSKTKQYDTNIMGVFDLKAVLEKWNEDE